MTKLKRKRSKHPKKKINKNRLKLEQSKISSNLLNPVVSLQEVDDATLLNNNEDTSVYLIPKDPQVLYAYWNLSLKDKEKLIFLKFYCLEDPGYNFYVSVDTSQNSKYIKLPEDNLTYYCELGFGDVEGNFFKISSSNTIYMQRSKPSERTDIIWSEGNHSNKQSIFVCPKGKVEGIDKKIIIDYYSKIAAKNNRKEISLNAKISQYPDVLDEEFFINIFKEIGISDADICTISSEIMYPGASEGFQDQDLFLDVKAELKINAKTNPNAKLSLNNKEVELNKDGTYSITIPFDLKNILINFCAENLDKSRVLKVSRNFLEI